MKKQKVLFALHVLIVSISTNAQKVKRIQQLDELNTTNAALWNRAFMQQDIIGSDFTSKIEIGTAAAERFGGADFWFPINVYKKTMGGELMNFYIYNSGGDHDHNLHIYPSYDFELDFRHSIEVANKRIKGEDPLVDDDIPNGIDCKKDDYLNFRVRDMGLEIDLSKSNAKQFFDAGKFFSPKVKSSTHAGDTVFAFGPWVSDAPHCFKPEIHPAEQIWWRKKINSSTMNYHLLLTCDQSDRFDEEKEFDTDDIIGADRYLKNIWAPRPLKGTFAIRFDIDPAKEKLELNLVRIGGLTITSLFNDGKINYLVYKNDTVAIVREPAGGDILKVDFEQLHAGFGNNKMYGFITIQAQVGEAKQGTFDASEGGYLFMKAEMKKTIVKKKIQAVGTKKIN